MTDPPGGGGSDYIVFSGEVFGKVTPLVTKPRYGWKLWRKRESNARQRYNIKRRLWWEYYVFFGDSLQ